MTVLESLPVALFCFSMVFVVLACLCGLIKLFSIGIALIERRSEGSKTAAVSSSASIAGSSVLAEVSVGSLRLKEVDEPTAAIIMAIVSDESGIPLSELNFKSIQLIDEETTDER